MEHRRLRRDHTEVCKFVRSIDKVNNHSLFFTVRESKTTGHSLQMRGEIFERDLRGNLFTKSVVHKWTKPQGEVVEAGTIMTYKRHLDII